MNTPEFLAKTQKAILKAQLPIMVLERINDVGIITGPDILLFIWKKYGVKVSPGTVYSVLVKLENECIIERIPKRKKITYKITVKGKKTIEGLRN